MALSGKFNEDKGLSPVQKVQLRVHRIEQVAMAFRVLSFLRFSQVCARQIIATTTDIGLA